jgi:hypothetical protein
MLSGLALTSAGALVVLAGAAMLPQTAAARSGYWSYSDDRSPVDGPEGLVHVDGRLCVKQCPNDRLPCDPPNFKQADGRCAQER